ncbi:hypothetical protein ASG90_16835 [Nocardioides sp. Soil797]|nr:hypothetical protein ASG90_16835 [Nocardioides sp. Soil797]
MGLRTLMRTSTTLVATTVVAALLTAPGVHAANCLDCDGPELPDDPGVPCPVIAATTDPAILSPTSPTRPVVGQSVTARSGVWNSSTKTLQVQWYVGGKAVGSVTSYPNTTSRTLNYTVRAEDQNKTIRLWVRGIGALTPCVKDEYSPSTAVVDLGPKPVNQTTPSVSGTPQVGQTLTAVPGTWTNAPESYAYEWFREGTVDPVGHGEEYTASAADLGKRIRVGVTAQRPGHWAGHAYTAFTAVVTTGTLAPTSPPTITGKRVFGENLTGDDGQWPAGTELTRRWERDGAPIPGATGTDYTLGLKDVGRVVSFVVTATRAGYQSRTMTASGAPVVRATAPVWAGGKISLKGTNKVNKKVKVALGVKQIRLRSAAPGAKVTYRWMRNGKAIKGSTKRAHVIRKADRKKRLTARITIVRQGHKTLVVTTKAVKVKDNGKRIR